MARKLSPEFKRQTARLVQAVNHAKKTRELSGHTTKEVKVYNMSWKSALNQSFKAVDKKNKRSKK